MCRSKHFEKEFVMLIYSFTWVLSYPAMQPFSHNIQAWGIQHPFWLDVLPNEKIRKGSLWLVHEYQSLRQAYIDGRLKCISWKVNKGKIINWSLFRTKSSNGRPTNCISRLKLLHTFLYIFHSTLPSQPHVHTVSSVYTFTYPWFPKDSGKQTQN